MADYLEYRDLFDDAPVAYLVVATGGTVLRANAATEALIGTPRSELEGQNLKDLVADESLDRVRQLLHLLERGEGSDNEECVLRHVEGDSIHCLLSIAATRDGEGLVTGGRCVIVDITGRSVAWARERQYARHLALLADSAMALMELPADGDLPRFVAEKVRELVVGPALVVVSDFDDEERAFRPLAILGLGDKLEGVLGLVGKHPADMTGDFTPEVKEQLRTGRLTRVDGGLEGLAGGALSTFVAKAVQRLFSFRDIYVIGFVREGTVVGGVCLLTLPGCPPLNGPLIEAFAGQAAVAMARRRAESLLRATEDQLHQSQKLEAIGQLAGGVAHDFNNMICAISGAAEIALESLDEDHEAAGDLVTIKGAADRAAALSRQLLAFSRKQRLEPRVLDLNAELKGIKKMLGRLIGEDISLVTELSPDLGCVKVDPGKFDQVVVNLVVNARDAMPHGGTLSIETDNVELDGDLCERRAGVVPGHYARVAISDTGCGMDDATRAHAFEPFFTTKSREEGTGLGLSTVQSIVKQSGGFVGITSAPQAGARFEVYLPHVTDLATEGEVPVEEEAPAADRATVLVVEDEDLVRTLVVRILSRAGYDIIEAEGGAVALEVVERGGRHIDLMLTDVVMPEVGGRKLGERCAVLRPEMPILYMSGYAEDASERNGFGGADVPFIQKPFGRVDLLRKVQDLLDDAKK